MCANAEGHLMNVGLFSAKSSEQENLLVNKLKLGFGDGETQRAEQRRLERQRDGDCGSGSFMGSPGVKQSSPPC